jgi:Na+/melibiose symporter-like transporter
MGKIGKKYCLIIGNLLLIPYLIAVFFLENDDIGSLIVSFTLSAIAANSFSVLFIVPW